MDIKKEDGSQLRHQIVSHLIEIKKLVTSLKQIEGGLSAGKMVIPWDDELAEIYKKSLDSPPTVQNQYDGGSNNES